MSVEGARLDLGGIRVLVADDDPIVRDLIMEHLQTLNAVAVEATDGAIAWQLLGDQSFDLAIVDLSMPLVDGFQLIGRIRYNVATQNLPILVVTSREDRAAIRDAFNAGASSFLVKPIDWPSFEHHLGFLLRLAEAGRAARIKAQQNAAVARAREAVLGRLCQGVAASAGNLADAAQTLAKAVGGSGEVRQLSRVIEDEARALHGLTGRVTELAGRLAGEILVEDRRENLEHLLGDGVAAVGGMADEAGVVLGLDVPGATLAVYCNGEAIVDALVQLLRNAIAHSQPGSHVWVRARLLPDGLLVITVSDDGAGMGMEFVAGCLNPMQSHERGVIMEGAAATGFGLLVVKAIAEAHNGNLEIRSMPGQGTDALFFLPAERVVRLGYQHPEGARDSGDAPGGAEVDDHAGEPESGAA